jgi:hypothetical protein
MDAAALQFRREGAHIQSGVIWHPAADAPLVRSLSMRGGSATLDIDAKPTVLAAGNTERFIAMWSLKSFEKIFQQNALVGVRGTFGPQARRSGVRRRRRIGARASVAGSTGRAQSTDCCARQGSDNLFDPPASAILRTRNPAAAVGEGACALLE